MAPQLFGRMMRGGGVFDPHILTAIQNIRAAGKWKIIALTNNFTALDHASPDPFDPTHIPDSEFEFLGWGEGGAAPHHLRVLFDDFCDSSAFGMRKPEPEFYIAACEQNGIEPKDAVFLDDIGANLKAAEKLGMETIHVALGESLAAVKKLEAKLGIDLTTPLVAGAKL
ncbi:hypothetical protein HWV62_18912 [Athelia sp. TMB]|nr:hypothetical protein HWV62_18912 [Athelia sp. TMB]